jgi:hypothetical protein
MLVLGPVLRRVEGDRATIWVETGQAGTVTVRTATTAASAKTFAVHGHHYALVVVCELPPESAVQYDVLFDGELVWPRPDDPYPAPVIRTFRTQAQRLVFGSCRKATPYSLEELPPDALDAYAVRLARSSADWPDLLVLLGDQVYADETPPKIQQWLRGRRGRRPGAPETEVVDFHEYTKLYLDSWTDPEIRWLLSTVPSTMIFDDHEIIDDWNSSASWRADVAREPWWASRIQAGFASYWVYQHLGNLAPSELADDPVYSAIEPGGDATRLLDEFGARADRERGAYRWSYCLDLGRTRLIVLDNRAAREVTPGHRAMLPDTEWNWFAKHVEGDYDHLLIGSSLPWLMPPGIHHLEAIAERLIDSPRPRVAAWSEKVRRALDLEHWAAFGRSFADLTDLLGQLSADGTRASICVLSGDVHHSYVARAAYATPTPVYQLTCSPVHNDVPKALRPAMRFGWNPAAGRAMGRLARALKARPPGLAWRKTAGPYFGNAVGVLVHSGREATLTLEGTRPDTSLTTVFRHSIAGPASRR